MSHVNLGNIYNYEDSYKHRQYQQPSAKRSKPDTTGVNGQVNVQEWQCFGQMLYTSHPLYIQGASDRQYKIIRPPP